jgi:hypothetical protein
MKQSDIYMIDKGKALKVGDTGELAGDGRLFKIDSVKPDGQHPFGFYGAINLKGQ